MIFVPVKMNKSCQRVCEEERNKLVNEQIVWKHFAMLQKNVLIIFGVSRNTRRTLLKTVHGILNVLDYANS